MKIEVEEICLVPPEANKPGRRLLSALSHFSMKVQYRTRMVFFECPAEDESLGDFSALVSRLRAGLAKALRPFYPVAGRLIIRGDDLMELDSNGEGVMLIRAQCRDVALRDLDSSDGDFRLAGEDLSSLAQTGGHILQWPWPSDAPLLFIQVTRFQCGGLCISLRFNHQLMDGTSAWHFWKSWAEVCRGEDMKLKPVWADEPIKVGVPTEEFRDSVSIPPYLKQGSNNDAAEKGPRNYANKCFVFKTETLSKLKQNNPGFSTFQLLTAHLWDRITIARHLDKSESTRLHLAVNCRGRLQSLDRAYGGQGALIIGTMALSAPQVRQDGLALIRETIQAFSEERIKMFSELVGMFASDKDLRINNNITTTKDVMVGSSFYFPVYEDFGFGKPVGMTIIPVLDDGRLYYFPGRDEGAIAAYICLKAETMEKLLADSTVLDPNF